MQTAGYIRVSSARQRDESDSPLSQRQRLEAAGCTVFYEDLAVSGFKLDQRRRAVQFQQLLADIRANRISRLLAVRLDRVARRDQIVIELAELCQRHGVELATLATGAVSTATAAGWLNVKINSIFGEHYSRVLSESISAGYRGLYNAGIPARSAASLPFYLQRIPGTRHGVEPSPHWPHYRHAIDRYLTERWTLSKMALYLNETCGLRMSGAGVRVSLRAPAICGHLGDSKGAILLPDVWPAMVTAEEHARILAKIEATKGRRPPPPGKAKLLTGVCRCALCGGWMSHDRVLRPCGTYNYLRCNRVGCNRRTVAVGPVWDALAPLLDQHIHELVQRRAMAAAVPQEPVEVTTWRRELNAREALPADLRQPADQQRIRELRHLIRTAEALPAAVEDWWPDGMAAGSVQFWSQRPEDEINADLRRLLRHLTVNPSDGAIGEAVWAA